MSDLLSSQTRSNAKNLRVAYRAFCLTLKVQGNVFFEKANRIDDAPVLNRWFSDVRWHNSCKKYTYLRPNNLLYTQKPTSPTTLRDADSFRVLDRDPLQRPVIRDLQRNLQLVLVDVVRRGNFVDSAGHFDCEIFRVEFLEAFWTLDAAKLGVDYDRGEVRGSTICD